MLTGIGICMENPSGGRKNKCLAGRKKLNRASNLISAATWRVNSLQRASGALPHALFAGATLKGYAAQAAAFAPRKQWRNTVWRHAHRALRMLKTEAS